MTLEETVGLGALIVTVVALVFSVAYNAAMINEMKKSRKSQIIPKLKGRMVYRAPHVAFFMVKNAGSGPALDLEATVELVPKSPAQTSEVASLKYSWRQKTMIPGEAEEFMLKTAYVAELRDAYDKVILDAKYTDLEGDSHNVRDELPFSDLLGPSEGIKHLWRDPRGIEYQIEQVKDQLQKIADGLKGLQTTIQQWNDSS